MPGKFPSYLDEHANMDTVIPELMLVVHLISAPE